MYSCFCLRRRCRLCWEPPTAADLSSFVGLLHPLKATASTSQREVEQLVDRAASQHQPDGIQDLRVLHARAASPYGGGQARRPAPPKRSSATATPTSHFCKASPPTPHSFLSCFVRNGGGTHGDPPRLASLHPPHSLRCYLLL